MHINNNIRYVSKYVSKPTSKFTYGAKKRSHSAPSLQKTRLQQKHKARVWRRVEWKFLRSFCKKQFGITSVKTPIATIDKLIRTDFTQLKWAMARLHQSCRWTVAFETVFVAKRGGNIEQLFDFATFVRTTDAKISSMFTLLFSFVRYDWGVTFW